jgi:hypothetical protein
VITLIGKVKPLKRRGKEEGEERSEDRKDKPYRGFARMNADSKSKTFNHKVEKPIFMRLRGPKALDDKGHGGTSENRNRTTD